MCKYIALRIAPTNSNQSDNLAFNNSQHKFKINYPIEIYDYFLGQVNEREKIWKCSWMSWYEFSFFITCWWKCNNFLFVPIVSTPVGSMAMSITLFSITSNSFMKIFLNALKIKETNISESNSRLQY